MSIVAIDRDLDIRVSAGAVRVDRSISKQELQRVAESVDTPDYGPDVELRYIRDELARKIRMSMEASVEDLARTVANQMCGLPNEYP